MFIKAGHFYNEVQTAFNIMVMAHNIAGRQKRMT